jgi:hypothetical protein
MPMVRNQSSARFGLRSVHLYTCRTSSHWECCSQGSSDGRLADVRQSSAMYELSQTCPRLWNQGDRFCGNMGLRRSPSGAELLNTRRTVQTLFSCSGITIRFWIEEAPRYVPPTSVTTQSGGLRACLTASSILFCAVEKSSFEITCIGYSPASLFAISLYSEDNVANVFGDCSARWGLSLSIKKTPDGFMSRQASRARLISAPMTLESAPISVP